MRIAAIYWPTSSVGGINTELRAFRDEADKRGDTFHVLRSADQRSKSPCVYKERKLVRGGDTFITIDGEAPHHSSNYEASAEFINNNYDRVLLGYLCPHPTKAYGDEPNFIKLLQNIMLPVTARISDGYWDSYNEWGMLALKYCESAVCVHRQVVDMIKTNIPLSYCPQAFSPQKVSEERSKSVLTSWTSQWKAIKGIHKLLPYIAEIPGVVEMYGNGILYYQLRTSPEWKKSMGKDHFAGFDGKGKAEFFGYVPLDAIPKILARSWYMIDLMGIGNPRNKLYQNGTFNNTTVEALYYGCCPILHKQASLVIPKGLCLYVDDASEVPALIAKSKSFALDPKRQKDAAKWVIDNFNTKDRYNHTIYGH